MIDKLLEKYNLKYEDLNASEKETLNVWIEAIQKSQITVEKVREYLISMKSAVEQELTTVGHNSNQDLLLKARLRNYLLLEAFLTSPEKAKEQLERAISGMASNIKA